MARATHISASSRSPSSLYRHSVTKGAPRTNEGGTCMHNESTSETLPQNIFGILQSSQRTAALTTAVQLDLFTAICDSGSSPDDIAAHCHASARGVRVLCDYLCVLGLLQKRHERYWPTEETALYLDRRSPHFIGDAAIQMFARRTFRGWLSTS